MFKRRKKGCIFEVTNEIITDAKTTEEFKKVFNRILLRAIMQIEFEKKTIVLPNS